MHMNFPDAATSGTIASAEGAATAFEHFVLRHLIDIDDERIYLSVERHMRACRAAISACMSQVEGLDADSIDPCLRVIQASIHTLEILIRLRLERGLQETIVAEKETYERDMEDMRTSFRHASSLGDFLDRILAGEDDEENDPANWWKRG